MSGPLAIAEAGSGTARGAVISPCGCYRYILWREIPEGPRTRRCLFVMLNPSTADAIKDDPTSRRCLGFAKRWGCSAITVVNLYAFRATKPANLSAELMRGADVVGPDNLAHVEQQLAIFRAGLGPIVAAWGANPFATGQPTIQYWLRQSGALCLGMNKDGSPRHPLYVKADQPLIPWNPKGTP
jgi:hypothetical protein